MAAGSGHTLWERIGALDGGGNLEPSTAEDPRVLADSVERNLRRVLNSRHGMSQAQPDYGLPALTDMVAGNPDHVRAVLEAIRVTVEQYEPRLRRVRVVHSAEENVPQRLAFVIEGTLVGQTGQYRVSLGTSLSSDGRFDVTL